MKETLLFATKNKHKMDEIREILHELDFHIVSMEEMNIDVDVVEDGTTFEENAIKKAVEIMKITHTLVLADDSGLEIDYLNKEPGIYSARYFGVDTPYQIKNTKILEQLHDVAKERRSARFVCVIAAAYPDGRVLTTRGTIEGRIHTEITGKNGFGYDPIFYVPEYGMTTAEMTSEQKNSISHRGIALSKMKTLIMKDFH